MIIQIDDDLDMRLSHYRIDRKIDSKAEAIVDIAKKYFIRGGKR